MNYIRNGIPVICEGNKVVHQRRQRKHRFVGLRIVCHEDRYAAKQDMHPGQMGMPGTGSCMGWGCRKWGREFGDNGQCAKGKGGIIGQNGEPSGRETRGDPRTPAAARSESKNEVRRRVLPSTSSQRLTPHSRTVRASIPRLGCKIPCMCVIRPAFQRKGRMSPYHEDRPEIKKG